MNNLRLWSAKPKRSFDLSSFNEGDYDRAVRESNEAELITRVLYPSENSYQGKELRLKQQVRQLCDLGVELIGSLSTFGALPA